MSSGGATSQKQGVPVGQKLSYANKPWPGARCEPTVELRCCLKVAIGLCLRLAFACQHPAACHSLGTSDAQRLRTARCAGATVSCADRQEAHSIARSMDRLRGCLREADRARFWMTHTCVGPVHVSHVHVPCSRNARALCPNEYAVSFIHQVRPLNRLEHHGFPNFHDSRFRPWAVSDRARVCHLNLLKGCT